MKYSTASKSTLLMVTALLLCLLPACREDAWNEHVTKDELLKINLSEAIGLNDNLSTFSEVLVKTGYDELLKSAGGFTVFAPVNSAWTGMDTSNLDLLKKLVANMIVYNNYYTDDDALYQPLKSVGGKYIYYNSGTDRFNGARIDEADNRTANGVIHITDKVVERKDNILEYLSALPSCKQFHFIDSLNVQVMDSVKSIAIGVDPVTGETKYDMAYKNYNAFLKEYPLNNEDSIFTYVVLKDAAYNALFTKYRPYFKLSTGASSDSVTNYNVCSDFVFKGIVDLTSADTLTNVNGVKVPFKNVQIVDSYEASNGRVYIVDQCSILLRDKIKPIKIEGENFVGAYDVNYVFTRYKLWASGERDVVLSTGESQSDTLYRPSTGVKDSVVTKTYYINSGLVANVNNFYIKFQCKVNSAPYDLYYVAYDDITDHFDWTYTRYGVKKVVQKMFISMPGSPELRHGIEGNTRGVANNYLGNTKCFVGEGMAGIHETTKLKQWNLVETTQLLSQSIPNADVVAVPRTGTMTMWLCNTALSNTANRQGLLFLDYILLVPRLPEE